MKSKNSFKVKPRTVKRGPRPNKTKFTKNLVFVGANVAGARSKWKSWRKVIKDTKASVFFVQETKCDQINMLKMEGFIIFDKVRVNKGGGGVAVAAKRELNPILVSEAEDNIDAITININTRKINIYCTSAYGPQTSAPVELKTQFWNYLNETAKNANYAGTGFILQGDLNATLGPNIIPGDPNPKNENGKLFQEFLLTNKLTAVNSLSLCKGVITRIRLLVTGKVESSSIDFYVVCERVLAYVTEMTIDSDKKHIATNFTNVQKGGKAIDTDHYTQILKVKLDICPNQQKRLEILNFKNTQCQEKFREITQQTDDFHKCLRDNVPNATKFTRWRNTLQTYCERAFRKIRVKTKNIDVNGAEKIIDQRNQLKKHIESKPNIIIQSKIDTLEKDIAAILHNKAKCNAYRFRKFCDRSNSFPVQSMWKLKKRIWPKKKSTLPVAKLNQVNKLVNTPREIKAALFQEYKERLRKRKIRPDFKEQKYLDREVTKLKVEKARLNKSEPFKLSELEQSLNDLNQGRARDPEGLCAELFQNKVIGDSLKDSLLIMLNQIKQEGKVPHFLNKTTVTTIPKPGSKYLLTNERGIFKVSIFRTILLTLLYNRNYTMVNANMSDSNIGARKGKGCRNHIWMLNGINHEHHTSIKK